ncbi:MAG: N-acetylmuramoyl-L-alanine amidase [Hyphomicrobium sp.]
MRSRRGARWVLGWLLTVLAAGSAEAGGGSAAAPSWEPTVEAPATAYAPPPNLSERPDLPERPDLSERPADSAIEPPDLRGSLPPPDAAGQSSIETGAVPPRTGDYAIADRAILAGGAERTTFTLGLSKGVTVEVFTLASPYRVVIDLPDVAFDLRAGTGRQSQGLVQAFRYGLFAEGKARIVLETSGPVKIEKAAMSAGSDGRRVDLEIAIVPMPVEGFGTGTGARRHAAAPAKAPPHDEPRSTAPKGPRPVIVIDPGHGGIDPGAVGAANVLEKTIALAVGHELRRALSANNRYEVRMTRTSDVFVSLDRRLKICRDMDADLFLSLHADSLEDQSAAKSIRGATVYTLSERASDEQARLMAEKENASDLIAGIDAAGAEAGDQVRNILIDLMKRETANFSAEFSKTLVASLGRAMPLARDPLRSAAFKVLKQTHAPAVLIELGYMSNAKDVQLLSSAEWQRQVAQQVRAAVDVYFARQTARAP